MKVVIEWTDGEVTTMEEVTRVEPAVAPRYMFLIQGRISQDHVNPHAVKSVKVFYPEEA